MLSRALTLTADRACVHNSDSGGDKLCLSSPQVGEQSRVFPRRPAEGAGVGVERTGLAGR